MSEIGFRGKDHFLGIKDSSREEIEFYLDTTDILHNHSGRGSKLRILHGHTLDFEFFEASTRTIKSTASAMLTMGGDNLPFLSESESSRSKGEPKLDTLMAASQSCDVIAIRDTDPDTMYAYAKLPKQHRTVPLINCGSGADEHPTQVLLDLEIIKKGIHSLYDLIVLILGDLKYGRVPHSLIYGLEKFPNNKVIGFPVKDLKLPDKYKTKDYEEYDISELPDFVNEIPKDKKVVLYATRVQWERIAKERYKEFSQFNLEQREKIREEIQLKEYFYEVTSQIVDSTPEITKVLHPLPRGPEISDGLFYSLDPKIALIDQMRYGLSVRMAILGLYCGKESEIFELAK